MSSAVNKSHKHFAPNFPRQRPGPRQSDTDGSKVSTPDPVRKQSQKSDSRSKRVSISKDAQEKPSGIRFNGIGSIDTSGSAVVEDNAADSSQNDHLEQHEHQVLEKQPQKQSPAGDLRKPMRGSQLADVRDELVKEKAQHSGTTTTSSTSPSSSTPPNVESSADTVTKAVPVTSATSSGSIASQEPQPTSSSPQLHNGAYVDNRPRVVEEEVKPPPGYRFVEPAELEEHKAAERRRKQAFERELLHIMRDLYAEREKDRLLKTSEGMVEEDAETLAREAAEQATYNQLKQAVGNEAKTIRDEKFGPEDQDNGELKPMLHPTKFTMAALCKDVPFGSRNDAYDDYELARVNRRRDTVRVLRAKMWSRRMYQPKEEEKLELKEAYKKYQEDRQERNGKLRSDQQQKFTEIDDASGEAASDSHPQASIEIQANGSISLVGTQFDRHKNNRSQKEWAAGSKTEVDPTEQVINSYSFSTRERPDRWTKEETAKFYEAVSALGTDFNLISHLFPLRSRNQIKTKYKYEEKRNPAKLQMYMVSRRKFNVDSYSQVSNVPIQDVVSIEDELEKVRQEHAEQMKFEEASRLQAKAEDHNRQSNVKRPASSDASSRPFPKRERVE